MTILFRTLSFLLLASASACVPAWTPPANSDPIMILSEAMRDRIAERYDAALAKNIWLFNHAHEISVSGGNNNQLLFGLAEWTALAKVHPPARVSIVASRDRADLRTRAGIDVELWFKEVVMFNDKLGESRRTVQLFKWLHANQPDNAKAVYWHAEDTLIAANEYKLCGQYINADLNFANLQQNYRHIADTAELNNPTSKMLLPYQKSFFARKTTILVGLLVLNGKPADATRLANQARLTLPEKTFATELDSALTGRIPAEQ